MKRVKLAGGLVAAIAIRCCPKGGIRSTVAPANVSYPLLTPLERTGLRAVRLTWERQQ